jgi:hypothetical protein
MLKPKDVVWWDDGKGCHDHIWELLQNFGLHSVYKLSCEGNPFSDVGIGVYGQGKGKADQSHSCGTLY